MKHILPTLLLLFTGITIYAQITPEKVGYKAYVVANPALGAINYFVSSKHIDKEKPLLLYIDGSGSTPIYQYTPKGTMSTIPLGDSLAMQYHIVVISKPGVPFADSVTYDERGFPQMAIPDEYRKRLSLQWRVDAANLVINEAMRTLKVDKKRIAIMGISEGFQVGSKLLTVNKNITHAILLVGNGLNQFYDFIIQARTDATCGKISYEEGQLQIEMLEKQIADIYAHPTATDKEWFGHTYLRWASFCANSPAENILSTNIPVYIVAASRDKNTSVLSADFIRLESIRLNKKNITYKVYPYDHSLNEYKDGKPVANHMLEAIADAVKWLDE